jgi:hypothetical protein
MDMSRQPINQGRRQEEIKKFLETDENKDNKAKPMGYTQNSTMKAVYSNQCPHKKK